MTILKFVVKTVAFDNEGDIYEDGVWEEKELTRAEVKEAVKDYLSKYVVKDIPKENAKIALEKIFTELDDRCDVEDVYKDEIAEYYGGKAVYRVCRSH